MAPYSQRITVLRCFVQQSRDAQLMARAARRAAALRSRASAPPLRWLSHPVPHWFPVPVPVPQVDLFVNYDCNLNSINLFEHIVQARERGHCHSPHGAWDLAQAGRQPPPAER